MAMQGHVQSSDLGRQSLMRLRECVSAGGLSHLATVDPQTGDVADPDARALFATLPMVSPATTPDELVSLGLLTELPKGLTHVADVPKYRVGREVFVRTTVTHQTDDAHWPVGAFSAKGAVGFTHRATLVAQTAYDFLVQLEGAKQVLPFAKTDVFSWNEAHGVPATGGSISGVHIDYNEPRLKAYICAAYLELAKEIEHLDFANDDAAKMQASWVHRLVKRIDMRYPGRGEGFGGTKACGLIDGGLGVCFVQRAVAGALLQAFSRVLSFDVQMAVGQTLRQRRPHGFLVVTLYPSLQRYVCDPAWGEPLTDLRVAFFDAHWGHDRRLMGFEGEQTLIVRPGDIDLPTQEPEA